MPPKMNNEDAVLSAIANLADATGRRFDKVDHQLADMSQQLDRIERIVLQDHERRLETIEQKLGIR